MLELLVPWLAQRSTYREVSMESSWNFHSFCHLFHWRQDDGCQPSGFKNVSQRTYGTRTEGSGTRKQYNIDPLIEHFSRTMGSGVQADFRHGY